MPAHRAVFERDDAVRIPALINDCAPMMLRVRPAQLTTTSVSGERNQIVRAKREFGAGAVDAAGDAHLRVFRAAAGCRGSPRFAGIDVRLDFLRRHARRVLVMLDEFAEGLARHVDAAVDLVTGRRPRIDAAVQIPLRPYSRCACSTAAARCARPSLSSHSTTRVERRGTSSGARISSRDSGADAASSRWRLANMPSSRTSSTAISPPSCSCFFKCGGRDRADFRIAGD